MDTFTLSPPAVLTMLVALIDEELKTLRRETAFVRRHDEWHADTPLQHGEDNAEAAIGVDSMELLSLATTVSNVFRLHESGLDDYLLRHRTLGGWVKVITAIRAEGTRDLAFYTSGSTAAPQRCMHRWQTLTAECDHFRTLLAALIEGGIERVIVPALPHHIYGFLFGIMLPERAGLEAVHGHQALAMIQSRRLKSGDLIVGYPFIWQLLARQEAGFPAGVIGLTSTGPCEAAVLETLKAQGLAHIVEIHGATETGGIGVRCSSQAPYALLPRWQRGDNAHRLIDRDTHAVATLADHLQWEDERHYYPCGRIDGVVQIGGINVQPQQVARLLETHPGVRCALVRPMTGEEGDRLKAFVVPAHNTDPSALTETLHDWCRTQLMTPAVPAAFTLGDRLPMSAMGKAADWTLAG